MPTSRVFLILGAIGLLLALPGTVSAHCHQMTVHAAQSGDLVAGLAHPSASGDTKVNHVPCCGVACGVPAALSDAAALGPSLAAKGRSFPNIVVPPTGPTLSIISPPG